MAISGWLERLKKGLAKTAQLFNFRSWFGRKVDQAFLEDLEKRLIQADVGVAATGRLIGRVREAFADKTADESLLTFVKSRAQGPAGRSQAGYAAGRFQAAECLSDRGSQRLGKDNLDCQAGAAPQGPGQDDTPGGLRYIPRGGRRSALDLGDSCGL